MQGLEEIKLFRDALLRATNEETKKRVHFLKDNMKGCADLASDIAQTIKPDTQLGVATAAIAMVMGELIHGAIKSNEKHLLAVPEVLESVCLDVVSHIIQQIELDEKK